MLVLWILMMEDKDYNKKIEKELLEEIKKNKEKTFSEFVEENVEKKS